ncbi:MAG TPA: ABC transporter substrate-binding protein [Pseudolabrys sp.]|nr:ABC transporter substrate-binding protein [Pseudolabrys sp.]
MQTVMRIVTTGLMLLVWLCLAWPVNARMAADAPHRVVSFNLCADQLVVALADPQQIAALSPYAADASLSAVADAAKRFPQLDWRAEGTLTLDPDLVLVGTDDRTATQRMLRRFGLRFFEVQLVTGFAAARTQIAEVAARLGHPQRGATLIAELDAAERRLAAAPRPPFRTALILDRDGYTQGGDSLAAALIAKAGLSPPPGAPGGYGGFVPLERVLTLHPDVLVLRDPPRTATDQGALLLMHPALAALYPPQRRIALPARFSLCGGPALVAAVNYLADELTRLSRDWPGASRR